MGRRRWQDPKPEKAGYKGPTLGKRNKKAVTISVRKKDEEQENDGKIYNQRRAE